MSNGDYAEMIEIPVSTCEMVVLPKKRKKKNIRERVIDKVNANLTAKEQVQDTEISEPTIQEEKPKKKRSFDIISAQVVAIFVLIVAILLTNIFWEDSGINNLIKGAFKVEQKQEADVRSHKDFKLSCPSKATKVALEEGVMTIASEGAVYAPCMGTVKDVSQTDGKYTITIDHSDVFKTVIRGADYAYFDIGETVYQAVPVCYSSGGVEVLMYDNNALLTNYTINDGSIVWQS